MEKIKPELQLSGTDGNVFSIMGRATRVARKAGWDWDKIRGFQKKMMGGDYDNALQVCMEYFDVI